MSADGQSDTSIQPASHCGKCYTWNNLPYHCPAPTWDSAGPWSGFINSNGDHRNFNSFVTYPSHDTSPNSELGVVLDATTDRDQYIPIWSQNRLPTNGGLQQQAVSISDNEWNPDVSIAPSAWDLASQLFDQSLSDLTTGFGQRFMPALSSLDFPPAIIDGQPDPAFRTPGFGVYSNDVVMPNDFSNFNSSQWDDLTAMDTQPTMTSFNQLSLSTISSMLTAPELPAHATSVFSTPAVPRPIARSVISRHPRVNTSPHTCDYPGCGNIFGRMGDFVRHRKQHGVPQHPCPVHGCNRRGSRAFYRADKLRDHQRKKHRMTI